MQQSADEILVDLQEFVAGRGRDDNFCYSKVYSPSSGIRCIDFSPWVGKRLIANDTYALAVFRAQLSKGYTFGVSISIALTDEDEIEIGGSEENNDDYLVSFEDELKNHEEEILKIIQFPFDEYFTGEFNLAKLDVIISWMLGFSREQFSRILMAYDLSLNNAQLYLERYNNEKKTQLVLPSSLPKSAKFDEFRKEFGKLPLSSRLHLFDILTYSGFETKKPKLRLISDMTLYDTRKYGIDEHESASILSKNKLIVVLSDGIGYINPQYVEVISIASEYAKGMTPVFYEWESDVSDKLSGFDDIEDFDDYADEPTGNQGNE